MDSERPQPIDSRNRAAPGRNPEEGAAGPAREPAPPTEPPSAAAPPEPSRTEQTLAQIRDLLEMQARERQFQTASPLLIVGLVVQVAVVGLIALALLDWAFANFAAPLYIKLLLAVVLQLLALTVFVVTREK
jgi:hypothetical protein